MNLHPLKRLDEAICDDGTGKGSSTRIALLGAAAILGVGLVYALVMFAVQTALGTRGAEGWITIISHLSVCLATVLGGYGAKMISCAIRPNKPEEPNETH